MPEAVSPTREAYQLRKSGAKEGDMDNVQYVATYFTLEVSPAVH
jgi:hypothetical protein